MMILFLAFIIMLILLFHSVSTGLAYVSQLAICIWEERKQRGDAETNQQKSGSDGSLPLF